jgi:hypothetical protein
MIAQHYVWVVTMTVCFGQQSRADVVGASDDFDGFVPGCDAAHYLFKVCDERRCVSLAYEGEHAE